MKKEEFVETLLVSGHLVNIGFDDYGQQYFFEYYDDKTKELKEIGCGTYNSEFKEEIEAYFRTDTEKLWQVIHMHAHELRDLENKIYDLEEKINGTKFNNESDKEN